MAGRCGRLVAVLMLAAWVLAAQEPFRPKLPHDADPNDWQAYFEYAVTLLPRFPNRADTLFFWAHRLNPARAEPLYARWVTFWLQDIGKFERYLNDDRRTLRAPDVIAADSLYWAALLRNPFVPQTLGILPFDQLPGNWRQDPYTLGWFAYVRRDFPKAAELFGDVVRSNPEKHVWTRYMRALAFVPMRAFDSASVEMTVLLGTLRGRDTTVSRIYYSKELIVHGIAMLQLVQDHHDSARMLFQQSLQENLAFYPAHAMLGDLAMAHRDTATAAREFADAAQLAPDEPWIQERYGAALLRMGRPRDAIAPLEHTIAIDSLYAAPYFELGVALAATGRTSDAIHALEHYVDCASQQDADVVADARRRLTALRAATNP